MKKFSGQNNQIVTSNRFCHFLIFELSSQAFDAGFVGLIIGRGCAFSPVLPPCSARFFCKRSQQ